MPMNQDLSRFSHVVKWLEVNVWDELGNVLPPRNGIWIILSDVMDGVMSAKYCYQVMREDRWQLATEQRSLVAPPSPYREDESSSSSSGDEDSLQEINSEPEQSVYPRKTFRIIIPPSQWLELQPAPRTYKRSDRSSGERTVLKLPKSKWTNIISELLWTQHEIPCAFAFKSGDVAVRPDLAKSYVTIRGHCTDDCDAKCVGRILNKPLANESVMLMLETEDTRKNKDHTKTRRCAGSERRRVETLVENKSTAVFRRHEASKLITRPGKIKPPILYSLDVYRKVKSQAKEGALGLNRSKNVMEELKLMKHDPKLYFGSIHDLGDDPIRVMYLTPGQLLLNNTLKKQDYHIIEVDATGPYCRRLTGIGGLSGQLLLYEIVSNTGSGTAQLYQMVTERHDAVNIGFWLEDWIRRGALCPNEVVCDNSAALLSALTRKFARSDSTKAYKEHCFEVLVGKRTSLPHCFVRLDSTHFLGLMSKWKGWNSVQNKLIKDHLLRFLGLLLLSKSISGFREKLVELLTVAYAQTSGEDECGEPTPVEEAIMNLKTAASSEDARKEIPQISADLAESDIQEDEIPTDEPDNIADWLAEIKEEVKRKTAVHGSEINCYTNKDFGDKVLAEAGSFVLWSSVMVEPFGSPKLVAVTAAVEGDFNDIKRRVLKNEAKPMKLDVFVRLHLDSIDGQNKLLSKPAGDKDAQSQDESTRQRKSRQQSTSTTSESEDDEHTRELRSKENWRNAKSKARLSPTLNFKKRKSTSENGGPRKKTIVESKTTGSKTKPGYLEPNPNISMSSADGKGTLKQPKSLLLKNGNVTGFFMVPGIGQVVVKNTCSFDALAQVLAIAFIDDEHFRNNVNSKKDAVPSLQVVASLAIKGVCREVYQQRAEALVPFSSLMQARDVCNTTRNASKRKSVNILEYSLANLQSQVEEEQHSRLPNGNVTALVKAALGELPSKVTTWKCPKGHENVKFDSVITVQYAHLGATGIDNLQDTLEFSMVPQVMACPQDQCDQVADGVVSCTDVLFVDLDNLNEDGADLDLNQKYVLSKVPCTLSLRGKRLTLAGIVAFNKQHYFSYCRRRTGVWEKFDDCNKKSYQVSPQKENITPHLIIYMAN